MVFDAFSEGRNLAEILRLFHASFEQWQRTGLSVELNVFLNNNSGGSQMNNAHVGRLFSLFCDFNPKGTALADLMQTHGF